MRIPRFGPRMGGNQNVLHRDYSRFLYGEGSPVDNFGHAFADTGSLMLPYTVCKRGVRNVPFKD